MSDSVKFTIPEAFKGAAAKIQRADEHIFHLNHTVNEWVTSNRDAYHIRKERDSERGQLRFLVRGVATVPPQIPVLAGEIIHHFASILDHLVWALVLANGQRPHNGNQFPFAHSRNKFEKAVEKGTLRGISDRALGIIEGLQPFQESEPHDAILSIIHYLDVIDKHRMLLVAPACAKLGKNVLVTSPRPASVTAFGPLEQIEIGNEEQELFWIAGTPVENLDAEIEIARYVAIEKIGNVERANLIEVIMLARERTAKVIYECAKALP